MGSRAGAPLLSASPQHSSLGNICSPQVSGSNSGEATPDSYVLPPLASPDFLPLSLPTSPPQITVPALILLLDGRSLCVTPLFPLNFISFMSYDPPLQPQRHI